MPKLDFEKINFKWEIITPIHIWSGENWDRLDYFLVNEWEKKAKIVDRRWLNICAKKDKNLFQNIVSSIEKWDFVLLEELKSKFYEKYFDKSLTLQEISISQQAFDHLAMKDKDYSNFNKSWIRWNLWEIKKFSFNKFWDLIIPWSTLKGLFRTMFLLSQKRWNGDYISEIWNLEKTDNSWKEKFSFIQFEDVLLKSPKIEIRWLKLFTERGNIPIISQVLTWWEFEIIINYDKNYFKDVDFENLLKNYSFEVIWREERILDNFDDLETDLFNKLANLANNKKYPVKMWMYKKSLTYKIFWEEELNDIYQKLIDLFENLKIKRFSDENFRSFYNKNKLYKFWFKWNKKFEWWEVFRNWVLRNRKQKPTKVVGQKLWIWDKSFYIDENQNPIWWISLELIK